MGSRRTILLIFIAALLASGALIATNRASSRNPSRPSLFDAASIGAPVAPSAAGLAATSLTKTSIPATPTPTGATPTPTASPVVGLDHPQTPLDSKPVNNAPIDITNSGDDLRSSQTRLDAIDQISTEADNLFADAGGDQGLWSVNQQGMDQQDYQYQSADGSVSITKWYGDDEDGQSGALRAEEAQLSNGEVIDRWYNDNGTVQQVMHQYDKDNSYSVYRYDTGEVEATRVIKNGEEIFTKYDRDGHQIQRTRTPANAL